MASPEKERIKKRIKRVGKEIKQVGRAVKSVGRELMDVGKELVGTGIAVAKGEQYVRRVVYKHGRMLGPGVIAGAADDDAGGIATYSIVGAVTGYALAWLMLLTTPMLIVVQHLSARLGNLTRKGLATLIKEKFGNKLALFIMGIVAVSNIAIIAANLAGMSVAAELITGVNWLYFIIPLSAIVLYILIFKNFNAIQKILLYMSMILLAYIVNAFLANPNWLVVLENTLIPRIEFNTGFLITAVGLLGATITPYLFFWQTSTEVEAHHTEKHYRKTKFDIFVGMIYSNIISYFIIISTATTLFPHGMAIATAQDAALALKPLAGDYSFYLFAVGLFGASMLAVFVLASSTAYLVSETLGWTKGLNKRLWQAKGFYSIIFYSIAIAGILLFFGVTPIHAMFYSQVFSGLIVPIVLAMIILISNDSRIVGEFKPSTRANALAVFTLIVLVSFVLLFLYKLVFP